MKMLKFLTLCLLVMIVAGSAQAGVISPGLEHQMSSLQDDDTVKVLVVMRDQADIRTMDLELHAAKAAMDTRHRMVLDALQYTAKSSQVNLLNILEDNKASGRILGYTSHWIVNAVVVKGSVSAIRDLALRGDVERIEPDLIVELIEPVESKAVEKNGTRGIGITDAVVSVGARRVWNELGIDGTGVIVGVLDTGVAGNHVALTDRWRGNWFPVEECWLDAAGLGHSVPTDTHGHGSHVMGTITGLAADDTIGIAPGAVWIASNIINSSTGTDFDNGVISSLEFMADPDGDPLTTDDVPAVVQNSWGVNEGFDGYYDCDSRWWDAIDNCEAAGVCLTWSAGNEGSGSTTLRSPADRAATPTNCFSVGSTAQTSPYTISYFSSRGPSGCGGAFAVKPEICAPGEDIYSVNATGGYTTMSGTSMAGPHIAGVVALMRASNPNIDVITVKEQLMATAIDLGDVGEDNTYGHGFVDAYAAVMAVMGGIGTVEGTITDSVTGLPVEGVLVQKVGGFNSATTDANGFFSMTMPAGDESFTLTRFAYGDGAFDVTIPEDSTVVYDTTMNPLASATISGVVRNYEGMLLVGASVTAAGTPVAPAITDANGFYSMDLPSGAGANYSLTARAAGEGYLTQDIELLGALTLDFDLPEMTLEDFETGDFSVYPWVLGGDTPWFIDSSEKYEGAFSAGSGDITHGGNSTMTLDLSVQSSGDISFYYKVSSESGYDFLTFTLDGVEKGTWSGDTGWQQFSTAVSSGIHTFSWTYSKDSSLDYGSDMAWVDFIVFPTAGLPPQPDISVDLTEIDVVVNPEGTTQLPLNIANLGEGELNYSIQLVEVEAPALGLPVNPVPHIDYAKGEKDERNAVNPLTGSGGPDAFGYSWTDSDEAGGPVYGWVDISDGTSISMADDSNHGPFDLGFPVDFYGNIFSSVNICSNGFVSFTASVTDYTNDGIPDTAEPNNLLAVFWDDMNPADGGMVYYKSEPENSRFIVTFAGVPHYNSGGAETFQVIINADGSIVYQYEVVDTPTGCTVGIENAAGDDGLMMAFNSAYLHNGLAIRMAAAPPLTWVTAAPLGGMVAPAGDQDVMVMFDAAGMDLGVYYAQLTISSNDLDEGTIVVPVTMTISSALATDDLGLPQFLKFTGAVPNPFNPATDIKFTLPRASDVSLKLYDVSGRLIRSLLTESLSEGSHEVRWNGQDDAGRSVASGTYFARLVAGVETSVKPLVLVR